MESFYTDPIALEFGDGPDPQPTEKRLEHTWVLDMYLCVIIVTNLFCISAYMFVFYKALVGTRYQFIMLMLTLLILSNIGGISSAAFVHLASVKVDTHDKEYLDELKFDLDLNQYCTLLRDCCLNLTIWCFSFRYWNISFVMLVQLSGNEVSSFFKVTSISIFITGLLVNILVPALRTFYGLMMNSGMDILSPMQRDKVFNTYFGTYQVLLYMTGLCQAISMLFLLWAIIRLYKASGRSMTLRELSTQTMMVIHLITVFVYLLSTTIYFIFFSLWDYTSREAENKVYISFTCSQILLFFVQLVLIYLFHGLSSPVMPNDTEKEDDDIQKAQKSDQHTQGTEGNQHDEIVFDSEISPRNESQYQKSHRPSSYTTSSESINNYDDSGMIGEQEETENADDDDENSSLDEYMVKRSSVLTAIRTKQGQSDSLENLNGESNFGAANNTQNYYAAAPKRQANLLELDARIFSLFQSRVERGSLKVRTSNTDSLLGKDQNAKSIQVRQSRRSYLKKSSGSNFSQNNQETLNKSYDQQQRGGSKKVQNSEPREIQAIQELTVEEYIRDTVTSIQAVQTDEDPQIYASSLMKLNLKQSINHTHSQISSSTEQMAENNNI